MNKSSNFDFTMLINSEIFFSIQTNGILVDEEWAEFYRREGIIELEPIALPYEGTEQTLKMIISNGGKNYIYTHRDAVTFKYLKKYGWMEYFEGFVTNEHNFPHKPVPDALLYMI